MLRIIFLLIALRPANSAASVPHPAETFRPTPPKHACFVVVNEDGDLTERCAR